MKRLIISTLILLLSQQICFAVDLGNGVDFIPAGTKLGVGTENPPEALTANGVLSIKEGSIPSNTSNFGKLFVNSATSNLSFLSSTGTNYDLLISSGITGTSPKTEWTKVAPRNQLSPKDGSGAESIIIGGTSFATGDIVLHKNGNAIFNEQGNNTDFRIASSGSDNAFFIEGANGNVGINTGNPASRLDIQNGAVTIGLYPTNQKRLRLKGSFQDTINSFNVLTLPTAPTSGEPGDLCVAFLTFEDDNGSITVTNATNGWTQISSVTHGQAFTAQSWYKVLDDYMDLNITFSTNVDVAHGTILNFGENGNVANPILDYSTHTGNTNDDEFFPVQDFQSTKDNTFTVRYFALAEESAEDTLGGPQSNHLTWTNLTDQNVMGHSLKTNAAYVFMDHDKWLSLNKGIVNGETYSMEPPSGFQDYTCTTVVVNPPDQEDPPVSAFNTMIWLTNGDTSGDKGDLMAKTVTNSESKVFTLIDFDQNGVPIHNGLTLSNLTANKLIKTDGSKSIVSESEITSINGSIGFGTSSPNEVLTLEGRLSLREQASSPNTSNGMVKLFVKSTDSNLYILHDDGNEYDFNSVIGITGEWADTGTLLHPADNSGEETVLIGGTTTNGADIILYNGGSATFNEQGNSVNFKIEGTSDENQFFTTGSDRVGMGTSTPSTKLDVNGTITAATINATTLNVTTITTTNLNSNGLDLNFPDGAVVFSNNTGVLSHYSNIFKWDNSNLRLKVDINSASETLTTNGAISLKEGLAPSNTTGYGKLYVKATDSNLYFLDSAGTETDLILENTPSFAINDLNDAKTNSNGLFMATGSGSNDDGENYNTAIGYNSSNINTSGQYNTALGFYSLYSNDKSKNTGIGSGALRALDNGQENLAIGASSAYNLENGNFNTFAGWNTYLTQDRGSKNTLIGDLIARQATAFENGVHMGYESGRNNTTGDGNTGLGYYSLRGNFTGNNNTALGYTAGQSITGSNNTTIGSRAGDNINSGSNNLILGYDNDAPSASASNQIDIADTIYGDSSNRDLSIAINNQAGKLTINGAIAFKVQGSDPSATEAYGKIYVKNSDNKLYFIDNGGSSYDLTDNGDFTNAGEWIETFTNNIRAKDDTGERTIIMGGTGLGTADIILHNGGAANFNEQNKNSDFRIESNSDSNIFFADASIDSVGIGTNTINGKLTLAGTLSLREISGPSNTTNYGKVYVDSTSSNLIFLDSNNIAFDLLNGSSATDEWTDIGSHLRPSDNSGVETVILGNTTIANADIILGSNGSTVFNEQGASVNFIVKSDNYQNMLTVNGTSNRVGIRTSSPSTILESNGTTRTGNNLYISNQIYYNSSTQSGVSFSNDRIQLISNGFTIADLTEDTTDSIDIDTGNYGFHINSSSIVQSSGEVGFKTGTNASNSPEELNINGSISFDNKASSDPAISSGHGKLYVKNDNKLYYKNDAGTVYEISKSDSDKWVDTSIALHPKDNSGDEGMVIGGTNVASSDIYLEKDGASVFNEQGNAVNFRVESDSIDNMFFVDGSNNRVGIGTGSPSERLSINGAIALKESAIPASASNHGKIYIKNDSRPYFIDESSQDFDLINLVDQTFGSAALWVNNGSSLHTSNTQKLNIYVGGDTILNASTRLGRVGDVAFNIGSYKVGFRVESNNNENSFVISGDNGCVGINTGSPNQRLTINGALALIPTNTNYESLLTDSDSTHGGLKMTTDGNLKFFSSSIASEEWFWLNNPADKNGTTLGELIGAVTEYSNDHIISLDPIADQTVNGQYLIAIGNSTLINNKAAGKKNIAIGTRASRANNTASNNIAIGHAALETAYTGNGRNIAIGHSALNKMLDGKDNVALGGRTILFQLGSSNVLLNQSATQSLINFKNNTLIGYNWTVPNSTNGISLGTSNSATSNRIKMPGIFIDRPKKTLKTNIDLPSSLSSTFADLFWIGSGEGLRLEPRASAPSSPSMGDIYVDTSGALCFYDGTDWDNIIGVDTDCS